MVSDRDMAPLRIDSWVDDDGDLVLQLSFDGQVIDKTFVTPTEIARMLGERASMEGDSE